MKKIASLILLFIFFNSYCQEKSIVKYSYLVVADNYITEGRIGLENLVTKGDSIFGYSNSQNTKQGKSIYFSKDNGYNWHEYSITSIKNINEIKIQNILIAENKLYIIGSSDWASYIYSSNDFGKTWILVKDDFLFIPNQIYYNNGLFILRTIGKDFEKLIINPTNSGVYTSRDCKEWKKISPENTSKISDVYLGKDEYYVFSEVGLYKASYNENILIKITDSIKSKFDNFQREGSQLEVIGNKFYSLFDNKLEEFDSDTNILKQIEIPFDYGGHKIKAIYSNNDVLFLNSYNKLFYYQNGFFSIKDDLVKKAVQDVFDKSGGLGFNHISFNKNQVIINGTTSFPFNAISVSINDLKTNDSKVVMYNENRISEEYIIDLRSKPIVQNSNNKNTSKSIPSTAENKENTDSHNSNCLNLKISEIKLTQSEADTFKSLNKDSKLELVCQEKDSVHKIISKQKIIGYRITKMLGKNIESITRIDLSGKIYSKVLIEYEKTNKYNYIINYKGLVVSLIVDTEYSYLEMDWKNGITKEEALKNYEHRNDVVNSPKKNNNKSYVSDGQKCSHCGLGFYTKGFCNMCNTASRERATESSSNAGSCLYCSGKGYVIPYGTKTKNKCSSCRGTGKQTY